MSRHEVARAAGADSAALAAAGDRGAAVTAMAAGAERVVHELHRDGRLDGILALGGSGGSSIAARAMRALPVGVPKLLVSTVASGDTRPYVGAVDVTMMYSVVDISGINRVSARIMANAAARDRRHGAAYRCRPIGGKPLVAATMFGVTTPCVTTARERLEELGYEVLVFHATGAGGQSMEALAKDGFLAGVLDVTTTELADELVGGVLSAGPDRLEAAGAAGVPAGRLARRPRHGQLRPARDRARRSSRDRNLYVHNPTVTLMRTTPEECAELGRTIGRKLVRRRPGRRRCSCPLGGVSMIDVAGPALPRPGGGRGARRRAASETLGDAVEVHERPENVNDPAFATAMADRLHELIQAAAMTRAEALARLRAQVAAGQPIIGAGAGTGLSAKLAEAGGADLIIIYNSGRYRMGGRGSLAGLMPFGDANEIVVDMAREVLPVVRADAGARRRLRHGSVPADARVPRRAAAHRLQRRAELPDGRPDGRHLPHRPRGDRAWATASRST